MEVTIPEDDEQNYFQRMYTLFNETRSTNDKRYEVYYRLETKMYYKYLINNNVLPSNKRVVEIGGGFGNVYREYREYLMGRENEYTCIDIDEVSINMAKEDPLTNYVTFIASDVFDYPISSLGLFDVMLLVQVYTCIPEIDTLLKRYFSVNANGKVIIVNSVVPDYIVPANNFLRDTIAKQLYGVNWGECLTFEKMSRLGESFGRHSTYKRIGQSKLSFLDQYIVVIQ